MNLYKRDESVARKGHIHAKKVTYSIFSFQVPDLIDHGCLVKAAVYHPEVESPSVKPGVYSASELEDGSGNNRSPFQPTLSFRNDDKAVIDFKWIASNPDCFTSNVEVTHGNELSGDNPGAQAERVKFDENGLVGEGVDEGVLANVTVTYTPKNGGVTVNHLQKDETYVVTVTTILPCSDKEFPPQVIEIPEVDMDKEMPMGGNSRGRRATARLEITPESDITISEKESVIITNAATGEATEKEVDTLTDQGRRVNDYTSSIAMDRILKAVNETG